MMKTVVGGDVDTRYLKDHAETRGFMLGRPVKPTPTPDGGAVMFLRSEPRSPRMKLYEFDVSSGKTLELLSPDQLLHGAQEVLSADEKARRERMRVSTAGFTDFQISPDGRMVLVALSGKPYVVGRSDGSIRELTIGAGTFLDPKFSPDSRKVAYVLGNDVYSYDLQRERERRVTEGGTETLEHGVAEFVAQEEMGRFSGYWWSPESDAIAFTEVDTSKVETWYVADPARPDTMPHPSRYPRPGRANAVVRLGVRRITGGSVRWLSWDQARYPYLARVDWDRRGGLTVVVQTRDQRELLLLRADPRSGETRTLIAEQDAAWVNIDQQMPLWLENGEGFLWSRDGDRGAQLEHRANDGSLLRVLVPAVGGFQRVADANPLTRMLVVEASPDPGQSHLFRVPLDGGTAVSMTEGRGRNGIFYSKNHELCVHLRAEDGKMPECVVRYADGRVAGPLPSVAEEPPFLPRIEWLRTGHEGRFYGMIVRPRTFDPAHKYPVLVYVYGGPGANVVLAGAGPHLLKQWLADQGFIVVSLDGRGTPGRGRDWERAISRQFGTVPLDDQVEGLQELLRGHPEMDASRVGIFGWSFGGYLSALAALKRPDIFKAAVAGAPVCDWLDYDTHYTERYLGMPDVDAAAYREGSLLTHVGAGASPLLVIHGTADDNVFFRHSVRLCDALFRAGAQFDLLPLPGLTHMVPDAVVTQRMYARMVTFFVRTLR